jgi:hypothetical protein
VLTLVISAGTSVHPLVLTLILVPFSVISLTSLGVRLPLILRSILVDHHPMIGVVIAVDKEDLLLVAMFGFRGRDVARPNFASGRSYW